MSNITRLAYAERLQTFEGYWDEQQATARQLAAIGHIYDRPPLEVLEEGSRCISCSRFVQRELSIKALGDAMSSFRSYEEDFEDFNFHHPNCIRLQVRIPLDPQAVLPGLHGYRLNDLKRKWERRLAGRPLPPPLGRASQSSSLFSLPTELRLEIYSMILPTLHSTTEIVPLNRDSSRVITQEGFAKTGPRDTTKPNILQTCRAVHEEAADLLYSNTTFRFASSKVMYLFLRSIGKAGRELLKCIDVQCGHREDAVAFALLASCEKLRAITIRLPRPSLLFGHASIWIEDGVACLLTLSGLDEVTFGRCESSINYMDDSKTDAAIIRRELTRPRGSPGRIRSVNGYLDV